MISLAKAFGFRGSTISQAGGKIRSELGEPVKDYHINIFFSDEDEGYIADIPDLEACSAFGATPDEALREVLVARDAWLESARQAGKPIPAARYRPAIYQLAGKESV
jgi:predicted RNase H-like HicB family nuclease